MPLLSLALLVALSAPSIASPGDIRRSPEQPHRRADAVAGDDGGRKDLSTELFLGTVVDVGPDAAPLGLEQSLQTGPALQDDSLARPIAAAAGITESDPAVSRDVPAHTPTFTKAARRISDGLDLTTRALAFRNATGGRVDEIAPGIYHMHFPTQHLLTSTFLRFQEHYESPKFRGKVFTLEEYMDWYAKNHGKDGHFTYLQDWRGFNIPSSVLQLFYEGKFDPLTRKEQALLDLFRGIEGKFYVIGTYGRSKASRKTLRHEIAHALYYIDDVFQEEAERIIAGLKLRPLFSYFRKTGGYAESVFRDEAQAYIGYNLDRLEKKGLEVGTFHEPSQRLQMLQRRRLKALRQGDSR